MMFPVVAAAARIWSHNTNQPDTLQLRSIDLTRKKCRRLHCSAGTLDATKEPNDSRHCTWSGGRGADVCPQTHVVLLDTHLQWDMFLSKETTRVLSGLWQWHSGWYLSRSRKDPLCIARTIFSECLHHLHMPSLAGYVWSSPTMGKISLLLWKWAAITCSAAANALALHPAGI